MWTVSGEMAMRRGFCHLHVHSVFSFLDSTLRVESIVQRARRAGMPAVALTDTNGLYAAAPFYKACREAGVKPIVGAEIDDPRSGERAVVLARNFAGYSAISGIVTRRHLGADWSVAANRPAGLTAFEAMMGVAEGPAGRPRWSGLNPEDKPHSLNAAAPDDVAFDLLEELRGLPAEKAVILTDAPRLLEALAGRSHFYAELILTPARRRACRELFTLARRLSVPLAATCDAHFGSAEDYETYKILRAIHYGATIHRLRPDTGAETLQASKPWLAAQSNLPHSLAEDAARLSAERRERAEAAARAFPILPPHHTFKTEDEMRSAFKSLGEAVDATGLIAAACDLELPLGEWKIPRPTLPEGETSFSTLWKIVFEGVKRRYRPLDRAAMERLRYELDIIDRLGFSDYFLTVHAIAEAARRRGFPLLGRGSAANSIVTYALELTGVDPIRHNLYFERFLNPERGAPPDIDLDFSWRDRDEILDWIYEAFGRDRVAMICTTITLQGRGAIRETAKALGVPESRINRFTRSMPGYFLRHETIDDLPAAYPECRDLPIDEEPWPAVLSHARHILDFPRHLSIHCGGVLICPEPITRYTPLQRAAKGLIVTQMDMHPIEDLGLIKIDLLANRSLGVFRECLEGMEEEALQSEGFPDFPILVACGS
jgi:DNA polymerase-3 subunit alpha